MRIIKVEWEDTTALPGWSTIEHAAEYADSTTIIISVGFELENDEEYVVLATSIAPGKVGEILKIPRGVVKKVEGLS